MLGTLSPSTWFVQSRFVRAGITHEGQTPPAFVASIVLEFVELGIVQACGLLPPILGFARR